MLPQIKKLLKELKTARQSANGKATVEQLQAILDEHQAKLEAIIKKEATQAKIEKLQAELAELDKVV